MRSLVGLYDNLPWKQHRLYNCDEECDKKHRIRKDTDTSWGGIS